MTSAPVIDSLYAVVGDGNAVSISGHVSDFDPSAGPISVAISGPISANVNVDSSGMFYYSGSTAQLGTEQAVAADSGTGLSSDALQSAIENMAPTIQNFSVSPTGDGKNVLLSGSVEDESPEGLTVSFSGVASGSTTTDAAGNFSLVALASDLGDVTATASDVWGAGSSPATTTLDIPPPVVQLEPLQTDMTGMVVVSGYVSGLSSSGASVSISGAVSGTATADASGFFSLSALSSGSGTVTVTATNAWNQTSSPAQATVGFPPVNAIPYEIVNVSAAEQPDGEYLISGTVQGGDLSTTTVSFTGSANGSVIVDSSGNFSFLATPTGTPPSGWESLVASDAEGDQSSTVIINFGAG